MLITIIPMENRINKVSSCYFDIYIINNTNNTNSLQSSKYVYLILSKPCIIKFTDSKQVIYLLIWKAYNNISVTMPNTRSTMFYSLKLCSIDEIVSITNGIYKYT